MSMRRPLRPLSDRRPTRAQISAEQLASLSHEFRTPLNGVLGMARLLDSTQLTAEQRAYVSALRESGQHLLTLVNDVLDFARLRAGKLELHAGAVVVEEVLRGVAELLSPRAREKGLEIAWAAKGAPAVVRADEARLKQILLNFAGNAVKFTETGGVLLAVTAPAPGRLRFSVEDTGPGVSASDRGRIFEAFAQAEAAHADLGGAGLGLAIARRLAHAMDGEVGVERARGGGACFWFEGPLAAVSTAPEAPVLAGRRVAVVSPNPVVRAAARRQIVASGGRAVAAADLATAAARTSPGDVLLVDVTLAPAGEALKLPEGRPAIVLLAAEERELIALWREAGCAGYLIKPLRRASLAGRVLATASRRRTKPAEDDRIVVHTAAAPGARVLLVEDNPINALLARALLTREGCEVEHVERGEDALGAVAAQAFDLVLMDMRMPGLSGPETARRMRAAGLLTPIVALTANAYEDDRQACLAAGMDDFLVKPLSHEALRAALTRWTGPGWTRTTTRAKVG